MEMLTVMAIISILAGFLVNTGFGTRPAGSRQGAISQLMGSLEEARMSAIEKGANVYFCIADTGHPDAEKQLRSYILCREQTAEEKAVSKTEDKIPLSRWETLPKRFFFDSDKLADKTAEVSGEGLPGNPETVRAIEFGSLGQVVTSLSAENIPQLAVTDAVYDQVGKTLIRRSGGADDFIVQIFRLTGRVRLAE